MTDRPCSVAEAHGRIYLLTANKLIVVSAADGCVLDSRPVTASTMVTLTDNAVIFGDGQGYVHVLDPTTLVDLQLVHATDSPLIGEVAVTDNGLFVVASDGTIARLYTEPCKTLSPGYPQNGHQAIGPYGVNTLSGNLVFTVPDVSLPFAGVPVNLRRTFNNQVASDIHEFTADGTVVPGDAVFSGTLFSTSLGRGWTHSYDQALTPELDPVSGATLYLVSDGRGRTVGYTMTLTGAMINPPGVHDGFTFTPTGTALSATFTGMGVILRNKRGGSRRFDPEGNLSCISDPIGNRLVFSYEPATVINPAAPGVRLTRIVYLSATDMGAAMPASVTVYLEYDAMARLSKVGCPNPSSTWFVATTYAYDDAGRLSDVAAPSGVRCHYEYDVQGRLTYRRDPRAPTGEKRLRYEYDALGMVSGVKDEDGAVLATYSYISDGAGHQVTTVVQPAESGNRTTLYTYTDCRQLAQVASCRSGVLETVWDGDFNAVFQRDGNGNSTTRTFDSVGNPVRIVDAKGGARTMTYDPRFSEVTSLVDENGDETGYAYDDHGYRTMTVRKIKAIPELEEKATQFTTTNYYDARGLLIETVGPRGTRTLRAYDAVGNLISTSRMHDSGSGPVALATSCEYDFMGRRTAMIDPRGVRTEYVYDLENRLVQTRYGVDADGAAQATTTNSYNDLNLVETVTDGTGRFVRTNHDVHDRVASVEDGVGIRVTYTYDRAGNLLTSADGLGHTTQFGYDLACRLSTVTDAALKTVKIGYDAGGNVTSVTDPNEDETRYQYDELNRRVAVINADGTSVQTHYDGVGRVLSTVDEDGNETDHLYDSIGRLRRRSFAGAETSALHPTPSQTFKYDADGNRTEASTELVTPGGNIPYVVSSICDDLGRLVQEHTTGVATKDFCYDAGGNRTCIEVTPDGGGPALRIDTQYDLLGRPLDLAFKGSHVKNTYEAGCGSCGGGGNLVKIDRPNGISTTMTYDAANQLLSITNLKAATGVALGFCRYSYDKARNRTGLRDATGPWTFGYDALNRLTSATHPLWPDQTYGYDPAGNRTRETDEAAFPAETPREWTYGSTNQMLTMLDHVTGLTTTYYHDGRGNLVGRGGTEPASLRWDAQNRLTQVVLPGATRYYGYDTEGELVWEGDGSGERWYVRDGLNVVMELNGARIPTAQIVPGVAKIRLDLPEPQTEYFLHDGLGSVVHLVDEQGNLTQEYFYEPFGAQQYAPRPDPWNRYRFVGLASDDTTGLIYMNARWYDPAMGRFMSRDPVVGKLRDTQTRNPYAYVAGNPLLSTDPTGLSTALFCRNVEMITFMFSDGTSETFPAANNVTDDASQIPEAVYNVGQPMPVSEDDAEKRVSMGSVRWPIEGVPGMPLARFHFGRKSYHDVTGGCIRGDPPDEALIKSLLDKDPWTSIDVRAECK